MQIGPIEAKQVFTLLVHASMGISLAACAGLRAFLPLLVMSILVKLGFINVSDAFKWVGSTPAIAVFSVATVTEILTDKVPAVDHFLDSASLFIKPVAGTILFSTVVIKMDPLLAVVLGVIVGGSVSELVHVKKAGLRIASSGLTGGVGNPILSIIEDVSSAVGVALSILAPLIAVVVVCLGIFLAYRFYRKMVDKKRARELEQERKSLKLDMEPAKAAGGPV